MFQNLTVLERAGFTGFKTIEQLWNDNSLIPQEKGIYVILNTDCSKKDFLVNGSGGFFKGRNPNVSKENLTSKWVEDCNVIYIGKAGGENSSATLRSRLKQYLDFGKGKPVGHYGGRFIWQLANHKQLIVAWKPLESGEPRQEERVLIEAFSKQFGRLPFANLVK